MKTRVLWMFAVLVPLAAGAGYWRLRLSHRAPEVQYKTGPVERRHIVGRVTASGTLSALVTVQVGTQVSGRIQKLYADFNSHVKKGELVAKIEQIARDFVGCFRDVAAVSMAVDHDPFTAAASQ